MARVGCVHTRRDVKGRSTMGEWGGGVVTGLMKGRSGRRKVKDKNGLGVNETSEIGYWVGGGVKGKG